MWGVKDPKKLQEIQARPALPAAEGGGSGKKSRSKKASESPVS